MQESKILSKTHRGGHSPGNVHVDHVWALQSHLHSIAVSFCRWDAQEVSDYVSYARQLAQRRSKQEWGFDLSWLQENGFTIPTHLLSLCGADVPKAVEQDSKDISDRKSAFVKGRCCFQ